MIRVYQFFCREDNFGLILHDETTKQTAAIDAPDAQAIIDVLDKNGWNLDKIFITHHHYDHIDGVLALKNRYDAKIFAPKAEKNKIEHADIYVDEGDKISFADENIEIIATPGHTLGEISYYLQKSGIVFTGDCLFSLGCGRIFEGTAAMMLHSLEKLRHLPDETQIYCGHEYSQSNANFALTLEPNNKALKQRASEIFTLRQQNKATLPSTIGLEKATNPFLRYDNAVLRQNLHMEKNTDVEVFAHIRTLKDNFKG